MFTFRIEQPTGKYKSFYKPSHHIKLKKNVIGSIEAEAPYKIRLKVIKTDILEDGNPNCEWKWITLKWPFESIDDAKIFLKDNFNRLITKFNLYQGQ